MSQPPIPYQDAQLAQSRDHDHLRILSICHYVCGGLIMLFSSMFIFHIVLGLSMVHGSGPFGPMRMAGQPQGQQMPPWFGYFFAIAGSIGVLVGWTFGLLSIYSGRCIAQRRRRVFSLVVAGILCAWFPFGTVLGVFTFIVLLRESVKRWYEAA